MIKTPKRGPFSDNYWRDWFLYHGSVFVVGLVCTILCILGIGLPWTIFGGLLMGVGIATGAMNYYIDLDRDFR